MASPTKPINRKSSEKFIIRYNSTINIAAKIKMENVSFSLTFTDFSCFTISFSSFMSYPP